MLKSEQWVLDLNGMMNLVGDVKKAHDKAKQMTDVLNQAK